MTFKCQAKRKRIRLKKYLVNNDFTLQKLGKKHKFTDSEAGFKKSKINTKKLVPMYIIIQLLNTETKKNITKHSQKVMRSLEGNSKSGNFHICVFLFL